MVRKTILEIYGLLLFFSLLIIFIGKYASFDDLKLAGTLFIFILGVVLMLGGVQYRSGSMEVELYFYDNVTLSNTSTTVTDSYSDYSGEVIAGLNLNHVMGFFMAAIGILSFTLSFFNLRRGLS